MTYQEQLDTFDWKRKRASIIRYNLYKCYFCGSTTQLQVHHKYYIKGVKAWEYPDDALVTLCESCHQKIHKLQTPLYYGDSQKKRYFQLTPCSRCGGSGYIPKYKNIEGGVCFSCQGARFREFYNIQMSDESSIEMLNHISISIKELAELTNNPELSYEFEDNLIKIVVYENKKEMGFYYLSPGDNLSKTKLN